MAAYQEHGTAQNKQEAPAGTGIQDYQCFKGPPSQFVSWAVCQKELRTEGPYEGHEHVYDDVRFGSFYKIVTS